MKEQILAMLKELQPEYDFEESVEFILRGYLDSFDFVNRVAELGPSQRWTLFRKTLRL